MRISDWSSDVCSSDLREFCSLTYDVDFPMFSKVDVNGDGAHPLWKWLKKEKGGLLGIDAIKWNFSKFLIGRDGWVIKRYATADKHGPLGGDHDWALGWTMAHWAHCSPRA